MLIHENVKKSVILEKRIVKKSADIIDEMLK